MIIVGIDFSPGSATAASVARRLAEESGAPWRLLHVRTSGLEDIDQNARGQWLEGLGLSESDVEQRRGVPWIELVRAVGEMDATFLVAGTHGRTGFQPLRLGQTAELVSLRSSTPVLLVPPMHTFVASAVGPTKSMVDRDAEARREAQRQRAILEEMVFFDYDDSAIRADAKRALDAKLPILRQNSAIRLQIAGHADERGSTEYNVALGSRRASTIRDYLVGFGLTANRFEVVSFGEGRPLDNRRAEAGWSRNRRAEFVIRQGLADS